MAFVEANSPPGHVLVHPSEISPLFGFHFLKEKRVYISQSVHVVLNMQAPSEYRHMNNLFCHNPTGNVLGIYILSSRALGEPSQQSWYTLSPHPFARENKILSVAWVYLPTQWDNKGLKNMLTTKRNTGSRDVKGDSHVKGSTDMHRDSTSHNGPSVYSRQFSFLPTIMREIEYQEMFVFLSIRPNNNIIPTGLQKHLSSKDSPENEYQLAHRLCQVKVNQTEALPFLFCFHLMLQGGG